MFFWFESCLLPSSIIRIASLILNLMLLLMRRKYIIGESQDFFLSLAYVHAFVVVFDGLPSMLPRLLRYSSSYNKVAWLLASLGLLLNLAHKGILLLIAFQRYFAVRAGANYKVHFAKPKRSKMQKLMWVISAAICAAVSPFIMHNVASAFIVNGIAELLTLCVFIYVYACVIMKIRTGSSRVMAANHAPSSTQIARDLQQHKKESLVVKLAVTVTLTYFVFNMPFTVYGFAYQKYPASCSEKYAVIFGVSNACRLTSRLTDPFVYFFWAYRIQKRRQMFRSEMIQTANTQ